jgi:hypothetical protein
MVQQDLNFNYNFEDAVPIHGNALPFNIMGITVLCDDSPDVQDTSKANEESTPVLRHCESVRSVKTSQQFS